MYCYAITLHTEETMQNFDYLYDASYFGDSLRTTHKSEKKLSYAILKNATLLPGKWKVNATGWQAGGGVIDENEIYINNSYLHKCDDGKYDFSPEEVSFSDETVIYAGMFVGVWGHCITDCIRRMWFLKSAEFSEKFSNCKIVYISYPDFKFGESFKTLLKIIGIDWRNLVHVQKITRFANVIMPDESFFTTDDGIKFTAEYKNEIDTIRNFARTNFKKLPFDKVYFTYSHFTRYKQIGERKLEQFFKKQGYKIIAPEKYSFEEQLNILQNCRSLASTIGSCSHNGIFMNDGAQLILIPRANYLTGYQQALDEVTDLKITYVSSDLSILADQRHPWGGQFFYYVSENLMKLFNFTPRNEKKFWKKNLCDFKLYLDLCFRLADDLTKCSPPEYYKPVLLNVFSKISGKENLLPAIPRKIRKLFILLRIKIFNALNPL